MKFTRRQGGFTLVEIAIVLVIIGLLLGGILKGQELIEQARIKRVINDFNNITAAILTYQDRYGFLPGDDLYATTRWPTADGLSNGNGNGLIDVGNGYWVEAFFRPIVGESNMAWRMLRLSGLVTGNPATNANPQTPWNTFYGMGTGVYYGWGANTTVFCASSLPPKAAEQIDRQFDDGNPQFGSVRANINTSPTSPPSNTTASTDVYVDNGTNLYTVCKRL